MRKLHFFGLLLCVLTAASAFAIHGDMGVGTEPLTDGSAAYPWLIEDLADFDAFADSANAATYWASGVHTKLMTNIDLSGRTYTTAVIAPDTIPTGDFDGIKYSGVLNGNDFVISNLTINTSGGDNDYLGLFGMIYGASAEVTNTEILECNIIGGIASQKLGSLCGENQQGVLSNCRSSGSITCGDYSGNIGGLCGVNGSVGSLIHCRSTVLVTGGMVKSERLGGLCGYNYGTISDCSATGSINAGYSLGGLCGGNYYGVISNCYATGSVTGKSALGGLCGGDEHGDINNCYAAGEITGSDGSWWLGGLCGNSNTSYIGNCYAIGTVNGSNNSEKIGGLCGEMSGTLENCYSMGFITSGDNSKNLGGLCGRFVGTINNCYSTGFIMSGINSEILGGLLGYLYSGTPTNCFWNVETSGTTDGVASADPDPVGVTGKSTAQMMTQSTFTGWDFSTSVWMMLREGEDYPRLAWQAVFDGDVAGLYGVDLVDFAYLARYWGLDCGSEDCGRADIDGGGDVGIGDLAAVAEEWLLGL
jgi:hypothetical protein